MSGDELQVWLVEHPRELCFGVSLLHVIAMPVVMSAVVAGYGQSEQTMDPSRQGRCAQETTMLVVAAHGGVLVETALPIGVLVDYVPVRVVLYYVRDASRWEILTIVVSTLHLIGRLAAA